MPRLGPRWWVAVLSVVTAGCGPGVEPRVGLGDTGSEGAALAPSQNDVVALTVAEPRAAPAELSTSGGRRQPARPEPRDGVGSDDAALRVPEGYVEMTVVGVAPTADGDAVLLVDEDRSVIVPIFVGNTEALAIELRHRKERFARPLTHDLLDEVMRELGGALVKVQVDDIKGKTFVGSVFIRANGRVVELDARPSDAIALALGNHVPIFVARRVVEAGGIRKDVPPSGAPPIEVPRI